MVYYAFAAYAEAVTVCVFSLGYIYFFNLKGASKRMKQRLCLRPLALLMIFLLTFTFFTGCDSSNLPDESSSESSSESEEYSTPIVIPETEPVYFNLVENGATLYKLVCADGASDTIASAMFGLKQSLTSVTGVEFEWELDSNYWSSNMPATAYEILIGTTNRPESAEAKALIRGNDFIIYEHNNRIVILGGTDEKTAEACDYFFENYISDSGDNFTVMQGEQYINRYNYNLGIITIDGVDIMKYTVVVPKNPKTLFSYYAALNLIDYLASEAGVTLKLAYDTEAETEYEIVIGETTRVESVSASKVSLSNSQYILKKVGNSVYMYGEDYMVGGAVSDFLNNYIIAENAKEIDVTGLPTSNIAKTFTFPEKATSALILIGDGMGSEHVEYAFAGRTDTFLATYLENVGTCTTYPYGATATGKTYTDSAASATALATGYKTRNAYLGLDHNKNNIQNVRELASSLGAKTAVLTSDVITGATPAGFLCHHTSRSDTSILRNQINQVKKTDKNLLFAVSVNDNRTKLLEKTREILYTISEGNFNGNTFFAMIEEAYIDKESHSNDLTDMKMCVLRYNDIIGYCIEFVMLHPNTALVITADHECGGLIVSGNSFSYTSTNHTNAKVPVYAIGPGTEMFKDTVVDNTDIGKFLGSAYTDKTFGDPSLD